MSPPTPRALRPLSSRLSRTYIMFNSPQAQNTTEDQFRRGGIFEGYEGHCISRGSEGPPPPPSTGERLPAAGAVSSIDWFWQSPPASGAGERQLGLHPDEEEADAPGEAGTTILPFLAFHGKEGSKKRISTPDRIMKEEGAVSECSSRRGSARSVSSSCR